MIWQCANTTKIQNFLLKHFLILTEILAVALAFVWPLPGSKLAHPTVSLVIVAIIFLFTGLKLKTEELTSVYKSSDIVLICCITSLFVTSLVPGYIIDQLPFDNITTSGDILNDANASFTFGPGELRLGAILFNCAPCTLATGIIMVTTAGGDVMVAVAVSTIANIAGCFVTPLLLALFVDAGVMQQDSLKLIKKLGLSLLLPLFVGKLVSLFVRPVREAVKEYKKCLGLLQSAGICLILWIKLSSSIYNGTFKLVGIADIAILFGLMLVIHLLLLLINFIISIAFCFKREHTTVMLLLISQKTLVLTAAIATALPDQLGDTALILLPCFIAHPLQMMVDSFLIQPLKKTQLLPLCLPSFCQRLRGQDLPETVTGKDVIIPGPGLNNDMAEIDSVLATCSNSEQHDDKEQL